MKLLGKVSRYYKGLFVLYFYIERKRGGWWKTTPILLASHKRSNLKRKFIDFTLNIYYTVEIEEESVWERWIDVEDKLIRKKFKGAVES